MPIQELYFPYPEQVFTPCFNRLLAADTRFIVNMGGTGSGKSFAAAQNEVLIGVQCKTRTLILRKVNATLKDSVIQSFKNRISEFDLWDIFTENKSDQIITCTQTGSEFIFKGLDDPEKLKSIEGINRVLIEEATELSQEDFLEVNRRVRGSENIQIVLCFNPIHEEHWLKSYFFDSGLPNCTIIKTTYLDNPFLTTEDRAQIEWLKEFNYNQYRIYALGDWGITENNNPWLYAFDVRKHIKDIKFLPQYPVYLSFDFNNDPFGCTAWQMSPHKGAQDSFAHCIQEFSGCFKIEDMCQRIKTAFPQSILYITGDRSGQNEDIGRNQTLYQMIAGLLGVNDKLLNLNTHNLSHSDSRMLMNTMFSLYPNIAIARQCKEFIADCQKAATDDKVNKPSQLKKDREGFKMDLFDSARYFFQTYFHVWAKDNYLRARKK